MFLSFLLQNVIIIVVLFNTNNIWIFSWIIVFWDTNCLILLILGRSYQIGWGSLISCSCFFQVLSVWPLGYVLCLAYGSCSLLCRCCGKDWSFRKIKYKRNPTTALNLRDALRWQNKCAVSNEMAWGCFAYFCFMDEFACTKESLFSFKERGDGQKICCLIQFLLVFIH